MTSTQASPRAPVRPGPDRRLVVGAVALVVLLVAGVFGIAAAMQGPAFVDRVTFENPTDIPVEIAVSPSPHSEELLLGTVPAHASASFGDIVDMGDSWTVTVTGNGGAQVTTKVDRGELADGSWRYELPESVRTALSRAGAIPSPEG